MSKKTETKRSENQTYFVIQVDSVYGHQFLSYNPYNNTFGLSSNEQEAIQFNQEERAIEVAQFHQKTAAMRSSDVTYKLFKKSLDTVEIALPKIDWLKDHKAEIEEEGASEDGVEIEED